MLIGQCLCFMNNKKYIIYIHKSPSGKCYIGQTCQILKQRWGINGIGYFKKKKDNTYCQPVFAKAIQKYGWEYFEHKVLFEGLTKLEADMIEKDLIFYYKKNDKSYNITDGGEGFVGVKRSPEIIKKIADKQRGKSRPGHPVSEETRRKIAEKLKGNINGKGRKLTQKEKEVIRNSCKKSLYQFDLDGNLIKIWECQRDAAIFFGCANASCMLNVANGKQYSAYGYRWSRTEKLSEWIPKHVHKKYVQQYTLDDRFIATFDSIKEASKKTGCHESGITNVCKGNLQTSGGYKWKYVIK